MEKIIIIGCGASGIVAGINAKNKNNEVIILEKNNKSLKKLLITGNGKCNYFNEDFNINHYYSNNQEKLSTIINKENKQKIINFTKNIGIIPKIKNGYYYPNSNQSYSVYNSLLKEAKILGISIIFENEVLNIKKEKEKFIINTEKEEYTCDKIIISTGGKTYPKTGSTGDGYKLAKKLNHQIEQLHPALVGLKSNDKFCKELSGVRSEVKATLFCEKNIKEEIGEIQFTDYGISGICIYNLSILTNKYLEKNKKVSIKINFFNDFKISTISEMINLIENTNKKLNKRTISELLEGYLNYKIVNYILKQCKINNENTWEKLNKNQKQQLAQNLIEFNINIIETKDYETAQVTMGGISLQDININTFESKNIKNLYFTGEVLDVTGECGGYNLGFAFLSGILAGQAAGGNND